MKTTRQRLNFNRALVAAALLCAQPVVASDIDSSDPAGIAQGQASADAVLERMQRLADIGRDRVGVIDRIVDQWMTYVSDAGYSDGWHDEFEQMLNAMTEAQLVDILNAESYQEVIQILKGKDPDALPGGSGEGLSETLNLGSDDDNLVLWPVDPCRIIDTRNTAEGAIEANTSRSFVVFGDVADQGGNPAGCPAPNGEPSGVVINVTSTNQPDFGFLTVYPFATPRPTASLVNYSPRENIANATVKKICFGCGDDLNIFSGASASDVVVDVSGYYYAVNKDDFRVRFAGSLGAGSTNLSTGGGCTHHGSVTITVPRPGTITVNAQAQLYLNSHTQGNNDMMTVYIGSTETECVFSDSDQGYAAAQWAISKGQASWSNRSGLNFDNERIRIPVSRTFTVPTAGTYTYHLNGERNSGAGTGGFRPSAMQATFYPDP